VILIIKAYILIIKNNIILCIAKVLGLKNNSQILVDLIISGKKI